jgi:PAS domain S-box-containing protein
MARARVKNPLADPLRVAMLRGTGLLGSPPDEAFDRLAGLARKIFRTPIAMVTLLDDTHLEAKSCAGPRHLASSPLKETFCQHVVGSSEPLVVDDAREHDLTKGLSIVTCGKALAYAGVPLTVHGYVIGTLCIADAKPRAWTRDDVGILEDLARSVLTEIALRADIEARKRAEAELERVTERLRGLMDNSPAVILGKDLEGRYLFLNRAGERALGMTEAEAIGRAGVALSAHDRSVVAGGVPGASEETLELGGETVVHRSVKFPLTDEAGEPYGICAISTDVTERAADVISGELGSAKALLRRLETAVDAAQSALSSAHPGGAAK